MKWKKAVGKRQLILKMGVMGWAENYSCHGVAGRQKEAKEEALTWRHCSHFNAVTALSHFVVSLKEYTF